MNRVHLNAETRAKCGASGAEFTDELGNIVGYFVPENSFEWIASMILPPPTEREIVDARNEMQESGGVCTQDVLAGIERANRAWDGRT
ncbi:MAG TPA: hypothetical protein VN641_17290 [Urbifossiella sp.]|nr:hypothetical protein [Urbifossiella sp.]